METTKVEYIYTQAVGINCKDLETFHNNIVKAYLH